MWNFLVLLLMASQRNCQDRNSCIEDNPCIEDKPCQPQGNIPYENERTPFYSDAMANGTLFSHYGYRPRVPRYFISIYEKGDSSVPIQEATIVIRNVPQI